MDILKSLLEEIGELILKTIKQYFKLESNDPKPEKPEKPAEEVKVKDDSPEFIYPMKRTYAITSPFGNRVHPIEDKVIHHNGVDFGTPMETPILAVCDAEEYSHSYQEGKAGYYNYLTYVTRSGDKIQVLYMHLAKALDLKAPIKKGDVIGYTGSSGGSTGPHLHFEIRKLNKEIGKFLAVDPFKYIPEVG